MKNDTTLVDFLILAGLIAICYIVYMSSFFSADDLWQIHFAHRAVNGEWDLLWHNFYANYMQLPGFDFYRPVLGISFAIDYLLSGTNPVGYHLTSLFLFYTGVVLLYLLLKELTSDWPEANSRLMALTSSALFAVSPMNAEDVVWISGRADTCCLPFFLGALLCAVKGWRGRTRLYLPLSLGLYMIALGCKELAVVMPVLVLSITFLWKKTSPEQLNTASLAPGILASNLKLELPTETEIEREEKSEPEGTRDEAIEEGDPIEPSPPVPEMAVRAIRALEYTSPFILLALTYLLLRFFIFGQSLGGYAGSFGIAMTHKFYWRWIEHDMLARLILPMPDYVQEISSQPRLAATIVVALCVLVGLLKFRFMEVRKRLFLIIFVWVLITLLPIANLLILDADLRNSRLLMFFTIPMSMLWPALLFHPTELAIDFGFAHYLRRFALTIGTALMTILIGSFAWCTFHVNKDWERAGYMVQQVWKGTVSLAGTLKKNERVILLGLPTSFRATHVIYNGSTFYDLLKPPFITPSITDKVVTFLPYIVGPSEIIDATRLKILLEDREHHHSIWLWNDFEEVFYPVKVNQSPESPSLIKMKVGKEFAPGIWRPLGNAKYQVEDGNTMILTDVQEEDGLIVTGLNINPLDADFLEFDIAITADPTDLTELMPLSVSWGATGGNSSIHALKKNEKDRQTNAHLRIRLSNNWRWYTKEHVDRFIIQVGAAKNIVIKNIMLTKADHLVPRIAFAELEESSGGEYVASKEPITLIWDNSLIPGAERALIQVTNVNYFFNNTSVRSKGKIIQKEIEASGRTGRLILPKTLFKEPGYYQVRMHAFTKKSANIGEMSDALTLYKLGNYKDTYLH